MKKRHVVNLWQREAGPQGRPVGGARARPATSASLWVVPPRLRLVRYTALPTASFSPSELITLECARTAVVTTIIFVLYICIITVIMSSHGLDNFFHTSRCIIFFDIGNSRYRFYKIIAFKFYQPVLNVRWIRQTTETYLLAYLRLIISSSLMDHGYDFDYLPIIILEK